MRLSAAFMSAITVALITACTRPQQAYFQPSARTVYERTSTSIPVAQRPDETTAASANASVADVAAPASAESAEVEPSSVLTNTRPPVSQPERVQRTRRVAHERIAETPAAPAFVQQQVNVSDVRAERKAKRKVDPGRNGNGITVAALVCGIVALIIFPIILGPLAIIFGAVGLSRIRRDPELAGRGRAIAGLVLGIIATVIALINIAR